MGNENQSFGKMIPLEKNDEGRSMREFESREPDGRFGIHVDVDSDGIAIIAKKNMIAADLCNYNIEKLYKRKDQNGTVAFFYSLKGDLNNCTVEQINIVAELLRSVFTNDYQTYFNDSKPSMTKGLDVKVNFDRQLIYLFYELKFESEWTPGEEFKEIK